MELWDVYDSQGNKTGRFKERGSTFDKGEYHLGTALWIINSEGKALLQKRSLTKKYNPGIWALTGGAASAGESSIEACLREVSEEIGLNLQPEDIKLLYRYFGEDCIFDDYITIRDFDIAKAVLQEEEVSELKWFTMEEIKALHGEGQFFFDVISQLDKVADYIKEAK